MFPNYLIFSFYIALFCLFILLEWIGGRVHVLHIRDITQRGRRKEDGLTSETTEARIIGYAIIQALQ